ncbi:MAG: UDP-N-acetylmuramoyl-L-alanyl-D-glutamate--2,6-diaminopimelate ligase [Planctomycetota bacterium]|jgi:UDP-N-acetylmuramoyl-L-alanyl-D-glutamate--2,6-diaminopimelate ligase
MKLLALLSQLSELGTCAIPDVEIEHVTCDSRDVTKGTLFVAVPGTAQDGSWFVPEAVLRGAVAVVAERRLDPVSRGVPVYVVPSARSAFGRIAAAFNGSPTRRLKVFGITGTNGKTTTTFILRHLLHSAGISCGVIGTVGAYIGDGIFEQDETTPDAGRLQSLFREMLAKKCEAAAIEVSSHALDQQRVVGTDFAAGIFTNISGDHLDYHGDMNSYLAAKAQLFGGLRNDAVAVLNADEECWKQIADVTRAGVVTYGFSKSADYSARIVKADISGMAVSITEPEGSFDISLPFIGRYNMVNFLAAYSAMRSCGGDREAALSRISKFPGVPGRLERIDMGQEFSVFVDYAHTDDALAKVIGALRPVTKKRLIVVFGCGGDRDRTKRARMGRVAGRGADRVVITSDNPRTEDPISIIGEILAGVPANANAECIPDRRSAIRAAVGMARPGDVVLISGKGHETYQILKEGTIPFDDREVVRERLRASA